MIHLDGKVALVTGASRGIGAAIAKDLASLGAHVIGTATTDKGAEAISQISQAASSHHKQNNAAIQGVRLNVTENESIAELMSKLQAQKLTPDILINNAGITQDNLLMRMSEEEWLAVINTNLSSIFRLSKACLRGMMKKRWGRIINISSVVASMGNSGQTNYAAAKAGIEGFTRSLAKEIGSRNITVNAIAPGFIRTDMTDALTEDQTNTMLSVIPLGRLGETHEISSSVSFLASDAAAYITGNTLHVNGGMYTC